jgi:hypothetical protein
MNRNLRLLLFILSLTLMFSSKLPSMVTSMTFLSDPFLQLPTETSVRVVWFTEFPGVEHRVIYGENLQQVAPAVTAKLSRMREDAQSRIVSPQEKTVEREIWRHEAEVTGLQPGRRVPYQIASSLDVNGMREEVRSRRFTLAPKPTQGTPLKILLTSDHQLMPMVAANLEKVVETVGRVDAIFFAGDLVNVPDRASEWFDDSRGGAFFPCLQGRANYTLEKEGKPAVYRGGELIQHAPLFPTIGNHEVMGRFSQEKALNQQFDASFPRFAAEKQYQEVAPLVNPSGSAEVAAAWIKNHSFNTDTYEEIFSLPSQITGGKRYYALTFGDIRLISLYVTNMWRSPNLESGVRGRFQEREEDLDKPDNWGYGQHIFEPIIRGSEQYRWLKAELESAAFQQAKYKIVMFHHPSHTLGGNIVPPYTNPVPQVETAADGTVTAIRYHYPPAADYIVRDLLPLLESAGVQFVFYGHSHLWNRFTSASGIHFLESSNVGNSYGAHQEGNPRPIPPDAPYAAVGNPNGLEPILPTISPLLAAAGQPLPYIASNDITVFSIFDTAAGSVSSYRFDTRNPDLGVIKFDEFFL